VAGRKKKDSMYSHIGFLAKFCSEKQALKEGSACVANSPGQTSLQTSVQSLEQEQSREHGHKAVLSCCRRNLPAYELAPHLNQKTKAVGDSL